MKDPKLCHYCGLRPSAPRPLLPVPPRHHVGALLAPQPLRCAHCLQHCQLCDAPDPVTRERGHPAHPDWRPALCATCHDAEHECDAPSDDWRAVETRFLEQGWALDIAEIGDDCPF
jgi:hypothetical protein